MEGEDHFRKNRESLMERGQAILAARSTLDHEDSVVQELERGSRMVSCVVPEDSTERRGGQRWRQTAVLVGCALVLCLSLIAIVAHGTERRVVTDTRTEDLLLSAAHVQARNVAAEKRIVTKHTPIGGKTKLAASAPAAPEAAPAPKEVAKAAPAAALAAAPAAAASALAAPEAAAAKPEAAKPAAPAAPAAAKPAPAAPAAAKPAHSAPTIVVESSAQAAPLETAPVVKAIPGPAVETAAPVQPVVRAVKTAKAPATVAHVAPAAAIAQVRKDKKQHGKAHAAAKPGKAAPAFVRPSLVASGNTPAKGYEQAPPSFGMHPEPRWAGVAPGAQAALSRGVAPAQAQQLAQQAPQGYQAPPRYVAFQQQAQPEEYAPTQQMAQQPYAQVCTGKVAKHRE
ncbi:hypothetical protein T484DRAFT_1787274 [Baffinella frigidus]|nr:hypothetical protein T484DRAFT_1787274 [Cryptophyta sp. CCMP2293]